MSLMLGGCSGIDLLNAFSPSAGVLSVRNLAYRPGARHRLDVYAPRDARNAPVVVFFYGGSWQEGQKADYAFLGSALARRGIVTIIPDYRVYPEGLFDDYMDDSAAAVAWAVNHASLYGADPRRLVLVGHSAGAQIATLLTLDSTWLARQALDPHRILAATVGLAGPYDFLPLHDPILKIIFGDPATLARTQPITFADGTNPPMLLANDEGDQVVDPKNTVNLAGRIRAAGGPVDVKIYRGLSHRLLIGAVSDLLGFMSPVRDDVVRFILAAKPAKGEAHP